MRRLGIPAGSSGEEAGTVVRVKRRDQGESFRVAGRRHDPGPLVVVEPFEEVECDLPVKEAEEKEEVRLLGREEEFPEFVGVKAPGDIAQFRGVVVLQAFP